jgi:hypothetical protein
MKLQDERGFMGRSDYYPLISGGAYSHGSAGGNTAGWDARWYTRRSSAVSSRSIATAGASGVTVGNTAVSSQKRRITSLVGGYSINTNGEPREDTALGTNLVIQVDIVKHWVGETILSLETKDTIGRVESDVNCAGIVGISGLNLGDEVLIEEELTNVGYAATGDGAVGQEGSVHVANYVNMCGAAAVVTGEDGAEGSNTVLIRLLKAPQSRVVEIGSVVAVTVARILNAGVYTGGIAVPHVPVELRDGLARANVDELRVHIVEDTGLVVDNILAVELALNPERADLALGGQNAGVVGQEDGGLCVDSDTSQAGVVVGVEHCVGVTTLDCVIVSHVHAIGTVGNN